MVELKIMSPEGLHARPAAVFCTEAKKYTSDITITKDGKSYNAKSVMMLMTAGIEHGDNVIIEATGTDSKAAESALAEILNTH